MRQIRKMETTVTRPVMCTVLSNNGVVAGEQLSYPARKFNESPAPACMQFIIINPLLLSSG